MNEAKKYKKAWNDLKIKGCKKSANYLIGLWNEISFGERRYLNELLNRYNPEIDNTYKAYEKPGI